MLSENDYIVCRNHFSEMPSNFKHISNLHGYYQISDIAVRCSNSFSAKSIKFLRYKNILSPATHQDLRDKTSSWNLHVPAGFFVAKVLKILPGRLVDVITVNTIILVNVGKPVPVLCCRMT